MQLHTVRSLAIVRLGLALVFGASAATDKPTEDPRDLLRQIRSHAAVHLSQLPNYTCHEVVDRRLGRDGNWNHLDTVEFEVALLGGEELFSKPGEERFGARSIEELPLGTISNGVLGSQIDTIFASSVAEFRFIGRGEEDGHKTFRYDLRVPLNKSGFKVKHDSVEAIVPFEGSVWVDIETLDLVRADLKVNRIPSYVGVLSIKESMHYQLMYIGGSDFLLPRNAELSLTDTQGNDSLNTMRLDRCREFKGSSIIQYDAPTPHSNSRPDHLDH